MADITTPQGIITLVLKNIGVLGVGQTPAAEDLNDAFAVLQMMLGGWQQQRWLVYHLVDVEKVSTGAQSYSVGTGGDFDTLRPDMIQAAYFRQLFTSGQQPVDIPFTIIPSREDYNNIALKNLGTYPQYLFYDATWPLGTIYLYPVPAASLFQIHLTVKESLQSITSLTQTIQLPPEYRDAIFYNLSVRLRPMYQLPPDPVLIGLAKSSLSVIRTANTQIPIAEVPQLPGNSGWFNIYSGQWE
jgi:hypothetical protein